jgi:GntP family gluconate:H+ symporter
MEIYQAAVAAVSFALVVVLSRRTRLPTFLSLLIAAFAFELTSQRGLGASGDAMSLGFAQTVETAGFAILAGAIVTAMLEATGAADRIAASIGKGPLRHAPVTAIPLGLLASVVPSATVALALLRPWCRVLQGRSAASRAAATATLGLALSAGQAFIYPCVVAVATGTILKINPLSMLLMGLPLALVASLVGAMFVARVAPRIVRAAQPPPTAAMSARATPLATPLDLAGLALPTLLPVALISVAGFAQTATEPLGRDGRDILGFWAKPGVILVLCFGLVVALAWRSRAPGSEMRTSLARALAASVWPLLVTGIAGGFAAALQNAGMAEMLGERVFALKLGLFVPFLAAALMKLMHGSSLVATLTAAGILEPLLPALGLDAASGRLLAAGAIAAGTLISQVNDPLFWLVGDIAGLNATQTLGLHSAGTAIQAAAGILLLWLAGLAML